MKDLLRKHPQWSHDCISVVGGISSKNIQEPKAKAALIWMLGEYAQDMSDAPYILENLIENWEEEHSAEVRLHLLTAAMKCFFKRAPETQKALGIALAAGIADFHQVSSDLSLPNFSCFETIGPLDHLFNINCWSRMFTIEPCSTIVFCNTTYMWLNVWLVLQNRRFQYLLTLKAVKSKTVYLTSLTAFL